MHMDQAAGGLIDSPTAWKAAVAALLCLGLAFGAPLVATVSLKAIAADMGGVRSVPALGGSLAWLGAAVGGLLMGRVAHRFGVRSTVMGGALSIFIGLYISTLGEPWQLWVGHGLFIGLLGLGGLNAPLYVYVSHWFDRRRGSALALLSSGNYVAGICWPVAFQQVTIGWGWRTTMLAYGIVQLIAILVLARFYLAPVPETWAVSGGPARKAGRRLGGLNPNVVFCGIAIAGFLCCVTMAMPQGHLVALCSDRGLTPTVGAAMLSVLLAVAFVSRQAWGLVSDRIGGIKTALVSSFMQAVAVSGYLFVQEQAGLFIVSIAFGLGFSALIPAYVLAVRELFPPSEAHWRVPATLLMTGSGMSTGGWLAGYLFDRSGSYDLPFLVGVGANVMNLAVLAVLAWLLYRSRRLTAASGTSG
jgi:MFS family permease